MFDRPQIPVVHHGAGQQDTETTGQRTQHGEPPGPAVNRFHGRVKAHGPTPEQCSTLGRSTPVNKNAVPNDPQSPFVTSGIRVGTPAPTTRGFKEPEMIEVEQMMCDVMDHIDDERIIASVRERVSALCARFPVYR